jgi:hypothetical protein
MPDAQGGASINFVVILSLSKDQDDRTGPSLSYLKG